jgi:hypothetical protein
MEWSKYVKILSQKLVFLVQLLYELLKRNIMATTPLYAAQVIIPKQQDNSVTAVVAMITINQNANKD